MKEVNISINSFIEKLKEVDVVELLEKAQSIKIEDIKKIKFADFKKSDYFSFFREKTKYMSTSYNLNEDKLLYLFKLENQN